MTHQTLDHARTWLRDGALAPDAATDPRGVVGDDDKNRRARAMKAAFAGEQGQLALETILAMSLFRSPVDHRLPAGEYRQYAQLREGQNQLAAGILAYLEHADTLERTIHDRHRRSPEQPGPGGSLIAPELAVTLARTVEPAGLGGGIGGSDDDWFIDGNPFSAV